MLLGSSDFIRAEGSTGVSDVLEASQQSLKLSESGS